MGLVVYGSLGGISGGYLYDRKLVEELARGGDEVQIISLPDRGYPVNLAQNLLSQRLAFESYLDILLQDELCHPSLFLLNRRLREKASFPVVAIIHNLSRYLKPGWFRERIERQYLESVDGFVFANEEARRSVQALVGAGKPWLLATPGVDHLKPDIDEAWVRRRAVEPSPLRVVFLGGIARNKGLHTLIEALERMPNGGCTLTVIGPVREPAYFRRVRARLYGSRLKGRVEFAGTLLGEALGARLRESHVLAVPSAYEAYAIAYLEGMGFGLPAIASSRGGAARLVSHGGNGFLVTPGAATCANPPGGRWRAG